MLLPFSQLTPWGLTTDFENKIKTGAKKTAFRLGENWKTGNLIDFWMGSPRIRNKNPYPFYIEEEFADEFKYKLCKDGVWRQIPKLVYPEPFRMIFEDIRPGDPDYSKNGSDHNYRLEMTVGKMSVPHLEFLEMIALFDGLTLVDFGRWFNHLRIKRKTNLLKGQILHWNESTIYDMDHV